MRPFQMFLLVMLLCVVVPLSLTAQSWQLSTSPTTEGLRDLDFADAFHGAILSNTGLWTTTDGGDTWSARSSFFGCTSVSVPAYPTIFVLGNQDGIPTLWRSTDWGTTWDIRWQDTVLGGTYTDMDFYDASYGVIIGTAGALSPTTMVLASYDGGATLNPSYLPDEPFATFRAVKLSGVRQGIIVGDQGAYAKPSGDYWTTTFLSTPVNGQDADCNSSDEFLASGEHGQWEHGIGPDVLTGVIGSLDATILHGAAMAGPGDLWMVGDGGAIAHSSPSTGGWTVDPAPPTTLGLSKVNFQDFHRGMAVGQRGTIIRYSDPYTFIPSAISPVCGATTSDNPLVLFWTNATTDPGYHVQVSSSPDFPTPPLLDRFTVANVCTLIDWPNGGYYWRVRVQDAGGFGLWSSTCTFTFSHLIGPVVSWPPCGDTTTSPVNLTWRHDLFGLHNVQVSQLATFDAIYDQQDAVTDTFAQFFLPPGLWYWRVNAYNAGSLPGPWSDCSVVIATPVIPPPLTVSPACGDTFRIPPPFMFQCNPRDHFFSSYQYQLSLDSGFVNVVFDTTSPNSTCSKVNMQDFHFMARDVRSTVFWRVRGFDATGAPTDWSPGCVFYPDIPIPEPIFPCGDTVVTRDNVFECSSVSFPYTQIKYEYSADPTFPEAARIDMILASDTLHFPREMTTGRRYWRVSGVTADGSSSPWSNTCSFELGVPPPVLASPACGDTIRDGRIHFVMEPDSFPYQSIEIRLRHTGGDSTIFWDTTLVARRHEDWIEVVSWSFGAAQLQVQGTAADGSTNQWPLLCYLYVPPASDAPFMLTPACGDTAWTRNLDFTFADPPGTHFPQHRLEIRIPPDGTIFWDTTIFAGTYEVISPRDHASGLPTGRRSVSLIAMNDAGEEVARAPVCTFFVATPAPVLLQPVCGDTVWTPTQEFRADGVGWPFWWYHWQVFDGRAVVWDTTTTEPTITAPRDVATGLATGRRSYRVQGMFEDGSTSQWAAQCTFFVATPAPTLLTPACRDTVHLRESPTLFSWDNHGHYLGSFDVVISLRPSFPPDSSWDTVITGATRFMLRESPTLASHGRTYWRVRQMLGSGDYTDWSTACGGVGEFYNDPPSPTLVSPVCGSTIETPDITFRLDNNGEPFPPYRLQVMVGESTVFWDTTIFANTVTVPRDIATGQATGRRQWRAMGLFPDGATTRWASQCTFFVATPAPVIVSPACGDTIRDRIVLIDWHGTLFGNPVSVYISTSLMFQPESTWDTLVVGADQVMIRESPTLASTGRKYVRVRQVVGPGDYSPWSSDPACGGVTEFYYGGPIGPPPPVTVAPACGSTVLTWDIPFRVEDPPGTSFRSRQLQIMIPPDGTIFWDTTIFSTAITAPRDLATGQSTGRRTWRVRGFDALGAPSNWSVACTFFVDYPKPVLLRPACGETLTTDLSVFGFDPQEIVAATRYQVQFSSSPDFPPTAIWDTFTTNTTNTFSRESGGGMVSGLRYWRVRAIHGTGYSPWSDADGSCDYFWPSTLPPGPCVDYPTARDTIWSWSALNFRATTGGPWVRYEWQMDTSVSFNTPVWEVVNSDPSYSIPVAQAKMWLPANFRVRVRGWDPTGSPSSWCVSPPFAFFPLEASPVPVYPRCGSTLSTEPLSFSWGYSQVGSFGGSGQRFELSASPTFETLIELVVVVAVLRTATFDSVPHHRDGYWRVAFTYPGGRQGAWSDVCTYQVVPGHVDPPIPIYPPCGSTVSDTMVWLRWLGAEGQLFDVQASTSESFFDVFLDARASSPPTIEIGPMPWDIHIYYRVRNTGDTTWTVCDFFHSRPETLRPPVFIRPACAETLRGDSLIWVWHSVPGASLYEIAIDESGVHRTGRGIFTPDTTYRLPAIPNYGSEDSTLRFTYRQITWTGRTIGADGNMSDFAPVCTLIYDPPVLIPIPYPTLPVCGSVDTSTVTTFVWSSSGPGITYEVQAYEDSTFFRSIFDRTTTDTSLTATIPHTIPVVYWKISMSTGDEAGVLRGRVSQTCMFDHQGPVIPTPQPTGGCDAVVTDSIVHVSWDYTGPAGLFQVEVSDNADFFSGNFDQYYTGIVPLSYDIFGLVPGHYFWRVRVSYYQRVSEWSQVCSFDVRGTGVGRVVLSEPACGDTVYGAPLTFVWLPVANTDSYYVQLSSDGTFRESPTKVSVARRQYEPIRFPWPNPDTLGGGLLYWRVRAFLPGGSIISSRVCALLWSPRSTLAAPTLISPECRSHHYIGTVTLVKSMVPRATYYVITLSNVMVSSFQVISHGTSDDVYLPMPGVYTWSARAVDSRGLVGPNSAECTFTLMGPGGMAPVLITAPETRRTFVIPHVLESSGRWTSDPYAEDYEIRLDTMDNPTRDPVFLARVTDTTVILPLNSLPQDRDIFMRVRGHAMLADTSVFGPWSPSVSFRVTSHVIPNIPISMVPETLLGPPPVCLHWTAPYGGAGGGGGLNYDLRFARDPSFFDVFFEVNGLLDTTFCLQDSMMPDALPADTTIYWDVTYHLPTFIDPAPWSSPGSIFFPPAVWTIPLPPWMIDTLCMRTDTVSEDNEDGISVYWGRDSSATRYRFQANPTNSWGSPSLSVTTHDTTFLFRPSDFQNSGILYWRARVENPSMPPGQWTDPCWVKRKMLMDSPYTWPRHSGDTALVNTWPPPQTFGYIIVYPGAAPSVRYEVTTLSDAGGAPIGTDIVTNPIYLRSYSSQPNGWSRWIFRLRALPSVGDNRYVASSAVTCTLYHGSLPPVALYGGGNVDSTIQVTWIYLAQTENAFSIMRTENPSSGYTTLATIPVRGDTSAVFTWQDYEARPHHTYYYKVWAKNTHFGVNASLWTWDAYVRSTFLPLRDGENYSNSGAAVWTGGAGTWPTWETVVRGYGSGATVNPSTLLPRLGAQNFYNARKGTWGGSCIGFSTIAQLMATRFYSSPTIFGAHNFDIRDAFWSGGTGTGRLHQFSPGSTLTNELTKSIHSIQVTSNWGNYYFRANDGFAAVWSKLTFADATWADSTWVLGFCVDGWGCHQIVPYKTEQIGARKRIWVYDENRPLTNLQYFEYDPSRAGRDTLLVYDLAPRQVSAISVNPAKVWWPGPIPPFAITARYAKAAGPDDYLEVGDSVEFSARGGIRPLIVNALPESLGYFGGAWQDHMTEGYVRTYMDDPDSTWEPFPYVLNPDSFRVYLHNPNATDTLYSISVVRPGRIVMLDSLRIGAGETDYLWIGPTAEEIRFRPQSARSYRLTVYHTNPDWFETQFTVTSHSAAGDSVGYFLYGPLGDSLRFTNWGAPTTYTAVLERMHDDHLVIPLRDNISIGHGHTHWITIGSWLDPDTTCVAILVDTTGDGRIDTILCGTTGIADNLLFPSGRLEILEARPNPVSTNLTLVFANPRAQEVVISLVDVTGHNLGVLSDVPTPAGKQGYLWSIPSVAAVPDGVYFLRIQAGTESQTVRVTVQR